MRRALTLLCMLRALPPDESFVRFYFATIAAQFHKRTLLQSQTDSVIHEPCGLLRDLQSAVNFPRADTVAAIDDHPHCREPLVQAQRTILKNGSGFKCELRSRMLCAAMPAVILFEEQNILASTFGAGDTVWPAASYHIFPAIYRIAEVKNCLLKCGRLHA
jgi:hypothetical protein